MALEPVWQPNYADLCDDSSIQFGMQCVVCGARYSSLRAPLVRTAVPGAAASSREIAEEKLAKFREFDAACRELDLHCFRCQRVACPDCWDEDNGMCSECVANRGLTHSTSRGRNALGPLGDGRLTAESPGRFHDTGRPPWVKQLLEVRASETPQSGDSSGVVQSWMLGVTTTGDLARRSFPDVDYGPLDQSMLAAAPTMRVASVEPSREGRRAHPEDVEVKPVRDFPPAASRQEIGADHSGSSRVTCPRCGTSNYDFVTRCSNCQLQLIQICPRCDVLNGGHAEVCESCGAPLDHLPGWTAVQPVVKSVATQSAQSHPAEHRPQGVRHASASGSRSRSNAAQQSPSFESAPLGSQGFQSIPVPAATGAKARSFSIKAKRPRVNHKHRNFPTVNVFRLVERAITALLTLAIIVIVVSLIAAVASASVDAFMFRLIHIDIRVALSHFIARMQVLWQQLRR